MSYMYINLGAYELHLGDEKCSTTLLMNARILHYTYDRGSLLFYNEPYICMLMLMTIYDTNLKP